MRTEWRHKEDMPSTEQFVQYLHDALDHLYDPEALRLNPICGLLGVADRLDTPMALRQLLIDTIESLRPSRDTTTGLGAWRVHAILSCRFVERFTQQELADQLGFSVRHLRREQEAALEILATRLWARLPKEAKQESKTEASAPASPSSDAVAQAVEQEVSWMRDASNNEFVRLPQVLARVLDLTKTLAGQHRVSFDVQVPDALPALAMHPTALEQALLSLLTVAMQRAAGGRLAISAAQAAWNVEILVGARDDGSAGAIYPDEGPRLEIAHRLVALCGGQLTFPATTEAFAARLLVPALEQVPVLAIDDNDDTLQLLKRYTLATRYRLLAARDPQEALELAKAAPRIILLDVMMPGVDGWELLGRLRQHPLTSHIPVLVVTVLDQEELALSLGAAGLVRKPVSRKTFLDALDRLLVKGEPAPR